ncbi:MAG: hypothetical protein QOF96_3502 [Actinomycetota bacterium]|jgi:hypothetical protein|nr:hypothetical protein [Actinomycetota bacterium]
MIRNLITLCKSQWDRTAAVALAVTGLVALLVAWLGVSSTVFTYKQMPYVVSGGLLGVCLVSMAGALWRSADLRDAWRKLDQLEELVQTMAANRGRVVDLGDSTATPPAAPKAVTPSPIHAGRRSTVASEV